MSCTLHVYQKSFPLHALEVRNFIWIYLPKQKNQWPGQVATRRNFDSLTVLMWSSFLELAGRAKGSHRDLTPGSGEDSCWKTWAVLLTCFFVGSKTKGGCLQVIFRTTGMLEEFEVGFEECSSSMAGEYCMNTSRNSQNERSSQTWDNKQIQSSTGWWSNLWIIFHP